MAWRDLLGRIDCPHCGTKDGMKITEDRAGNPFGNCDVTCHGQLRIGDRDKYRVGLFYKAYPHVNLCGGSPVTVTGGEGRLQGPVAPVTVTGGKIPITVIDKNEGLIHGSAAATTKPGGGEVTAMPKKRTYAEELAQLVGGMRQ